MDRIDQYRKLVLALLQSYVEERPVAEDIETQLVTDTDHDHYQLVNVGWLNGHRIYGCVLHIDLKGDKGRPQHLAQHPRRLGGHPAELAERGQGERVGAAAP